MIWKPALCTYEKQWHRSACLDSKNSYLNFQVSSKVLQLCWPVCVRPGWKPLIAAFLNIQLMKTGISMTRLIYCVVFTVGEGRTERAILTDILDDLWEKLIAIATAREQLQQFR